MVRMLRRVSGPDQVSQMTNIETLGAEFGNATQYLGNGKSRSGALNELLESDDKFGFIIMDFHGTLFGTLSKSSREVLHKFWTKLPMSCNCAPGRGCNQEQQRWRMEMIHDFARETAELATQFYIDPATSQPNVSGLILAGSADFKKELSDSHMLDPRLQAKVLNVVEVQDVYEPVDDGFNQAIYLSADILVNTKWMQENLVMRQHFREMSQAMAEYGHKIKDTLIILDIPGLKSLEEMWIIRKAAKAANMYRRTTYIPDPLEYPTFVLKNGSVDFHDFTHFT